LSEIVQLAKWNSTVSKCACVRRLAVVTLLLLLESFRRYCLHSYLRKRTNKDAGIQLTNESTGSEGIRYPCHYSYKYPQSSKTTQNECTLASANHQYWKKYTCMCI